MKKILKVTFVGAISVLFFINLIHAQATYEIIISGVTAPCPGNIERYTINAYEVNYGVYTPRPHKGNYIWSYTNGQLQSGGGTTHNYIDLSWNDVRSGHVAVEASVQTSSGGYVRVSGGLIITQKSLKNYDPINFSGINTIYYGDTSSKTYSISPILFPDNTATNIYKWIIPAGWSYGGVVSNGTTPMTTSTPNITVTPDVGCNGNATISVYGQNDQCSNKSNSNTISLSITRTWPSSSINGDNYICSSKAYTIANLPSNCSVVWSSGSKLNLTSNQGSIPANFTKTSVGSGIEQITAVIKLNGCPTIQNTIYKNVWVGTPIINNISGPQNLPYGGNQVYTADVSGADGATYQWSVSPSLPLTSYGDNVQISFPSTNGDYVIGLVVVTSCGSSAPYYFYVTTGEYEINIIYPNPASDETTLSLESALPENKLDDVKEWEYEIYNQNQSLKEKKTKLKGYTTKINTSSWKEGVYIVRVKFGKEVFQGKLIIER